MSIATETATAAPGPAVPAVPAFLELGITGLGQLRFIWTKRAD